MQAVFWLAGKKMFRYFLMFEKCLLLYSSKEEEHTLISGGSATTINLITNTLQIEHNEHNIWQYNPSGIWEKR
jgi:hypothetical protein